MRLADFIIANIEPILMEWEIFARSIMPAAAMDALVARISGLAGEPAEAGSFPAQDA